MGHINCIWHIFLCFVGSIAKLDSLVSCTDSINLVFSHFSFQSFIYSESNVCRLFINCSDYRTGICIKTIFTTCISNFTYCVSYNLLNIHISVCCNLTHYHYKTCSYSCFTCNTAHWVFFHNCIKNRIRNSIAHFVRMAFSYRFRSK